MKKIMSSSLAFLACATCLSASGYRIPEQSFASVAKAGANTASAFGADASYYNPANMSFMKDKSHLEFDLIYINLPKVKYADFDNPHLDSKSEVENFLAPALHYVSPKFADDFTFGLSLVAPGGLAKRWEDPYAKGTSEKFALEIFEINPNIAYKVNDNFSVALGARMTYIKGEVKSDGVHKSMRFKRDLTGDSFDFGYNVALSYKPIKPWTLAATYRSNIDLTVKGDATLKGGPAKYKGSAGITVPLPAVLALATSYDFGKTVVELAYEKTFWSTYKDIDVSYDKDLTNNPLLADFDNPLPRNWEDVDCFRIGISHELTDKLTVMGGFAYDKSPIPDGYVGFELPGSDAKLYSLGASYKINKDMSVALGYLFDKKDKRVSKQRNVADPAGINGKFENASAHLVTASFMYEF